MRERRSREVKLGSVPWDCNQVSLTSGPVLPSTSQSRPRGGELPGAPAVPCPTLTPRPSYRYVSQPPAALTPSLPLSSQCQVSPGQATPRLETIPPPQEAANIRGGGAAVTTWLLSCKEKRSVRGGVGHQIPADFRVESVQLKCILLELSSVSTEPPLSPSKLLLPTTRQAATKQAVVMEPECGVPALPTAPETLLCLPTLPLFKNKTKNPTPPSALQHPKHQGRTDSGGRTLHRPAV